MRYTFIIFLFLSFFGFSQVPDTETFTLDTVRKVVNPSTDDLDSLFILSTKAYFDPLYDSIGYAPVRSLKRFRNYKVAEGCVEYGYLYNWYAATDARNIAASGWHVPTNTEFTTLAQYAATSYTNANDNNAGLKLNENNSTYWSYLPAGRDNSFDFNGRGAGYREHTGTFSSLRSQLFLMSTTDGGTGCGLGDDICYIGGELGGYADDRFRTAVYGGKRAGCSIRLVKDSTSLSHGETGVYIGNDGKIYPTICIGNQVWLSENLAETKYRDGSEIPTVTDGTTWAGLTTGAKCAYDNNQSYVGCGE